MLHPTSSRRRARSCAALALLLLPACAVPGDDPDGDSRRADGVLAPTQIIALRSYWNGAAGDNALSTDPSFAAAGYVSVRVEGYLLRPEVPPRAGTRPVYTWYSSARGDYFTTTNTAWAAGLPGETRAGYTFVRMEGYAFNDPAAGTAPLQLWWSAGRADNHSTTDPAWASPTPATRAPDYAFAGTLGHIIVQDPEAPAASRDAFHFGTMGPGAGERSVFVLMGSYRDAPMRHTRAQEDALFFGPAAPNARDYANEMSGGAFRWARGGLQGYAITDDPDTHADEALWGVNQDMANPVMAYAHLDHTDATTTGVTRIGCRDGGGGALFNSPGADAWETLGLDDLNGAALYSGESVRFKCFGGQFVASDGARLVGTGTGATAARFIVESATGPGVVHNGEGVRLRLPSGQYVAPDLSLTTVLANASLFTLRKTQPDVSRQLRGALREAAAAGVSFAGFDRDLDGVVRRAELTFALVIAGPSHTPQIGAATRNVGVFSVPGSSLRLEPAQALVAGEDVALASIEHELTHTLGAYDLYGAAGLNDRATLMGPTIAPTRDERDTYHLDPWHKMRLGWVSPRIVAVTSNGGSARLDAPSRGGAAMTDAKRPLLVYDPARYDLGRRSGEFFLVEHRDPAAGGYDANAAPSGVVIWQVSTDANGAPRTVASTTVLGGLDSTVNALGAPGLTRGGTTAWTSADGLITPTWLDGTSAPFSLRVAPRTATGVVWVEWSRAGALTARLDTTVTWAQRGGILSVGGVFPVASAATSVALLDDLGRSLPLSVTSWDGATIRAMVPAATPAGDLRVVVRNGAATSNSLPVTIR